jgi:hypothetical protein
VNSNEAYAHINYDVTIIIDENWTSSSFVMRKRRKKVWQTREIRPPQEVNEVWQTKEVRLSPKSS